MPGSEHPDEFMFQATEGLRAINEASLERRYETDPNRAGQNTVPHDDFIAFKNSGSSAYDQYTQADARQQADVLKPAVTNIEMSREFAIIENKLPLSRRGDQPRLNTADFDRLKDLLEFGSIGARALLAAEADARSQLRQKLLDPDKQVAEGTLTTEQLALIDSARATVQIKRFELDKYLLDVERAVHNEVCKRTGEAFADGRTWKDSGFAALFTGAGNALEQFNRELQQADTNKPNSLENLPDRAGKVRSALGDLLDKAPSLVKAMEENTRVTWINNTPVTDTGLELQLTLIAQEVGQQAVSRIAPSYMAAYRFAGERPGPAKTPTLFQQMRNRPDDQKFSYWLNRTQTDAHLAFQTDQGQTYAAQLGQTKTLLEQWQTAIKTAPVDGPAKICGLSLNITTKLRSLEQSMVQGGVQEKSMGPLRDAIDAAFIQLRYDTYTAVDMLAGGDTTTLDPGVSTTTTTTTTTTTNQG
jgi:hypothetical protein